MIPPIARPNRRPPATPWPPRASRSGRPAQGEHGRHRQAPRPLADPPSSPQPRRPHQGRRRRVSLARPTRRSSPARGNIPARRTPCRCPPRIPSAYPDTGRSPPPPGPAAGRRGPCRRNREMWTCAILPLQRRQRLGRLIGRGPCARYPRSPSRPARPRRRGTAPCSPRRSAATAGTAPSPGRFAGRVPRRTAPGS